jgi:GTPase SAR1 family protein
MASRKVIQSPYGLLEPCRVAVVGASGSGKTEWMKRYLLSKYNSLDKLIWLAPKESLENQPALTKALRKHFGEHVTFVEYGDPQAQEIMEKVINNAAALGYHTGLVVDDAMLLKSLGKWLDGIAIHGRHRGVSLYWLVQKMKSHDATRRAQLDYGILFRSGEKASLLDWLKTIANSREDGALLQSAYKKVIGTPYSALILDLKGNSTPENPIAVRHATAKDLGLTNLVPELWNAV